MSRGRSAASTAFGGFRCQLKDSLLPLEFDRMILINIKRQRQLPFGDLLDRGLRRISFPPGVSLHRVFDDVTLDFVSPITGFLDYLRLVRERDLHLAVLAELDRRADRKTSGRALAVAGHVP